MLLVGGGGVWCWLVLLVPAECAGVVEKRGDCNDGSSGNGQQQQQQRQRQNLQRQPMMSLQVDCLLLRSSLCDVAADGGHSVVVVIVAAVVAVVVAVVLVVVVIEFIV